jgi:acyl-CoA thioester hydrolase
VTRLPEPLITYRGAVFNWHCDHMGHMNVMWYVNKFDEATWQLLSLLGLSPSHLKEAGHGMAALEQNVTYRRELRAGDVVTVRSSLIEIREKTIRFRHEMTNDESGELAASSTFLSVHFDLTARRACPFPEAFRSRAEQMIADQAAD